MSSSLMRFSLTASGINLPEVRARRAGCVARVAVRPVCSIQKKESQDPLELAVKKGAKLLPLGAALWMGSAGSARAQDANVVDGTVNSVIEGIKVAGEVAKRGIELGGTAVETAKGAYEQYAPQIQKAADVAVPVVTEGLKKTGEAVAPVVKALEPQVKDIGKAGKDLLTSSGVDPKLVDSTVKSVSSTTDSVITTSKPIVQQIISFLTTSEPVVLAEVAAVVLAVYYLGPPALGGLIRAARGYAGEVSAAAALDAVCNDGSTLIVDIRTQKEKESSGVPDLPVKDRLVELDYAIIEDKRTRNQLRNPASVEAQITAMQVAALKRLSKNTTILLMDRYGNGAKSVARDLSAKGFKKCYVIAGGFDGRGGWNFSKLPIKVALTYSNADILPPLMGRGTGSTGISRSSAKTTKINADSRRKALPSST